MASAADKGAWLGMPVGRFIATIGIPSTIALFLVWQMASGMGASVRETAAALKDHVRATDAAVLQQATLLSIMRQICINTAQSQEQLRECAR